MVLCYFSVGFPVLTKQVKKNISHTDCLCEVTNSL